jgi:hypothetical protein
MYKSEKDKQKESKREKYRCQNCEKKPILEYTERFAWHGSRPSITKAELKCPHCKKTYWVTWRKTEESETKK